jgi:adenosylhomocysteine nucleosidase
MRLGIVTALAPETAIAKRAAAAVPEAFPRPMIRLSGPGLDRARRTSEVLVTEGAEALMCFGMAAGLDPALRAGDIVVADRIVGPEGEPYTSDARWRDRLLRAGRQRIEMRTGGIASAARPITGPEEKARLFGELGAIALDMESAGVAAVARGAGLPFLAVRAIADAASRRVPTAAVRAMDSDGRVRPAAAIGTLIAHPGEIGDFLKLARDGRAALRALRRVALLVPGFGIV